MQVSILTPLFNRLDLTRVFLESLERTLRRWTYEVILVDDGSIDGTREFLQTLSAPRYRVVLNERGLGYAANNNLAARMAQAPLLCLLNNDTVLRPGWLEPMARLARMLPDVACVGNVQREPVSGLVDHAGIYFREDGVPLHAGKDASAPPTEDYLEWAAVTAACCVVRREVFLRLGGFDEGYRNGLEDVDFCLRAAGQGYRHFVANRSVIYHHVSASPGRKAHEEANLRHFLGTWGGHLAAGAARPRTLAAQREAGLGYLRQHRWQPWRFNAWQVARAVEQVWSPDVGSRRLDAVARGWFAWEDALGRRKAAGRPEAAASRATAAQKGLTTKDTEGTKTEEERKIGAEAGAERNFAGPVFLVVGETARTASRAGVPTFVRGLAGACGRRGDPVRLVGWCAGAGSLRVLPPEWSVGCDAEALRQSDERDEGGSAPSLCDPAAGAPDDPLARAPALHELTGSALPPRGSWVVLPEVSYAGQAERLAEYVRRHGWRLAVVLHDLLAVNEPELFLPDTPNDHDRYLRACSRADLVLPASDFTAHDWRVFTAAKGLAAGRVEVCKLAADTVFRPRVGQEQVRQKVAGEPVRMLCVSSVEARKNHRTLVEAFAEADRRRPDLRLELCCVGEQRRGPGNPAAVLHAAMERYPGRVTWYERVAYSALRGLYEACDFAVYPSVLEGGGLPILESLWFRKPCVCANFGVMDEVAYGGGCVTVDVRDAGALAEVIVGLAADADRREALAAEIDARWLRCWEEYARDLLALLGGAGAVAGRAA